MNSQFSAKVSPGRDSFRRAIVASLCVLVCFFQKGATYAHDFLGQEEVSNVLPATTHWVVTSQNVQATYSAIERSDLGKHLLGPIWKSVALKQAASLAGSLLNPKPWFGLDWTDIQSIQQPGAIAAFLDQDGNYALVFLAKLGSGPESQSILERWMENQGGRSRIKDMTFGTTALYSLLNAGAAKATSPEIRSQCMAVGPKWLCISSSSNAIEKWLSSEPPPNGTPSSLLATQIQPAGMAASVGECQFRVSLWELLAGYARKQEPKLFLSAQRMGLDGLGTLTGVVRPPNATDLAWSLRYSLRLANPSEKALAMLSFKKGPPVELPRVLTQPMDELTQSYVDIKPWFQGVSHTVDQMIDEETPGNFADLLDSILSDPEGPKVDIRKELIYKTGPLILHASSTVPDEKATGVVERHQIWCCSVQDAKQAKAVIQKLFSSDEEVKSERIGKYECWSTINEESLFVAVSNERGKSISIAAIDDSYLYLSNDKGWFKQILNSPVSEVSSEASSLGSQWQATGSSDFSLRQILKLDAWLQPSWYRLPERDNQAYGSIDFLSLLLTKTILAGIEQSEIPDWKQIRTILGVLVHESFRTSGGIEGTIRLQAK